MVFHLSFWFSFSNFWFIVTWRCPLTSKSLLSYFFWSSFYQSIWKLIFLWDVWYRIFSFLRHCGGSFWSMNLIFKEITKMRVVFLVSISFNQTVDFTLWLMVCWIENGVISSLTRLQFWSIVHFKIGSRSFIFVYTLEFNNLVGADHKVTNRNVQVNQLLFYHA